MLLITSVWLLAIVAVVGLCFAAKAAEATALSLPRSHGRRRAPRYLRRLARRPACTGQALASWRPTRRA